MSEIQKKILLNMSYFTLISLSIVCSGFFVFRTYYSNFAEYIKIIYYILTGLLVLNLIYDIICTIRKSSKFIVGIILFALAIAAIIMSTDVLIMEGITFKVISEIEIRYFINTIFSFAPFALAIFAFLLGESLIDLEY